MGTAINPSARTVAIPVGLSRYRASTDPHRTSFQALARVPADLKALARLFSEPRFVAAGCQLLDRVSGTAAQVRAKLNSVVDEMRQLPQPRPAICLLWAGHAAPLESDDLRLATADSFQPILPREGLTPVELVDILASADAAAVYVILDVCQAAAAAANLAETAIKRMTDRPPADGQQATRFAFLCSAQAYEEARDGLFGTVLVDLLRRGPSAPAQEVNKNRSYGSLSPNDAMLTPRSLGSVLDAEFEVLKASNKRIQQPVPFDLSRDFPVFPNPLWTGEAKPRPMAPDGGLPDGGHGSVVPRPVVVEALDSFTSEPWTEPGLLVIKGEPGVGTSTALEHTRAHESWLIPRTDGGDHSAVDVTVDLFRRSPLETTRAILSTLEQRYDFTGAIDEPFIGSIERCQDTIGRPLTIVLDAYGDADDPRAMTTDVVKSLLEAGSRVVVGAGTVPVEWAALVGVEPETLDLEVTADSAIDVYVGQRLAAADLSSATMARLRPAVVEKARQRFLSAVLIVDHLLASPEEQTTLGVASLPDTLSGVFGLVLDDLDQAFATTFGLQRGATALARGLAWGAGQGVPRADDLWTLVASAASGLDEPVTDQHVDWFLDAAGKYVWETSENGQAVYRLSNSTLADHLRASTRGARDRIATALVDDVHRYGGWSRANPYIRASLPWYLADQPDRLVQIQKEQRLG